MKRKIALGLVFVLGMMAVFAYSFSELNAIMLRDNLDILKAKEDEKTSLLDYQDAKWGYSPTVDLLVTGSYLLNPIEAIRLQKDEVLQFLGMENVALGAGEDYLTLYKGQENMMYQFSLTITQPLFTWGKIPKAVELYKTIYSARSLQVASLGEQYSTELKTRMAVLSYMREIRVLLLDEIELAEQLVSLSAQGAANGVLLDLDVKNARVQARELNVALSTLDDQISQMLGAVAKLCGMDSISLDEIEFKTEEKKYLAMLNTDLPRLEINAVSENKTTFQLLGKLQEVALLARDIANASVNWKPDVAFVASLGYSGSRLPVAETDWYRKDSPNSTLTVAIKTTLWDGGDAVRNVARTQSKGVSAELDTSLGRQEVLSKLRENYGKIKLADSMISYYDSKIDAAMENVDRQNELLSVGAASDADVIKAKIEVQSAQITRLQELIELVQAYCVVSYLGS